MSDSIYEFDGFVCIDCVAELCQQCNCRGVQFCVLAGCDLTDSSNLSKSGRFKLQFRLLLLSPECITEERAEWTAEWALPDGHPPGGQFSFCVSLE